MKDTKIENIFKSEIDKLSEIENLLLLVSDSATLACKIAKERFIGVELNEEYINKVEKLLKS